jgi:uncharacterized membrane protein
MAKKNITRKGKPDKDTLNQWHDDPYKWRFGIIYYNKKDKRLFPPKKYYGLGWTVNFANPISIVTFFVIVLLLVSIVVLLKR